MLFKDMGFLKNGLSGKYALSSAYIFWRVSDFRKGQSEVVKGRYFA